MIKDLFKILVFCIVLPLGVVACQDDTDTAESRDAERVQQQQSQYEKGQPIPAFDWSLERDLVIKLYMVRNQKVSTHSVWRADYGMVEGDCPSYGYGIPYDTSLTNPLAPIAHIYSYYGRHSASQVVEQAEPNGVFASKNTSATWVMCLGQAGTVEPVYVESKVTVYPGPVKVDYATNRVTRSGAASVLIPTAEAPPPPADTAPVEVPKAE